MNASEKILLEARELLRTTTEAVAQLRLSFGPMIPVVVSSVPQIPRAIAEAMLAHQRVDEPLTNALMRLVEARAHLALAQAALPEFNRVREQHQQALVDLAASRRAEDGEKPS